MPPLGLSKARGLFRVECGQKFQVKNGRLLSAPIAYICFSEKTLPKHLFHVAQLTWPDLDLRGC